MYSTVSFEGNGTLRGTTTLKNYNNFFGFTGGVFVVALDSQNNAVYATGVMKYGINASGFRRKELER
ncbi:MAG: hypothetical protein GY750_17645 [Lentisphaerae bacterium]|nr:hypothetical protein [Lentisphaerota bacterium]MCP4103223.1 hypothetical protein [Lentisphaerota bacterium]